MDLMRAASDSVAFKDAVPLWRPLQIKKGFITKPQCTRIRAVWDPISRRVSAHLPDGSKRPAPDPVFFSLLGLLKQLRVAGTASAYIPNPKTKALGPYDRHLKRSFPVVLIEL